MTLQFQGYCQEMKEIAKPAGGIDLYVIWILNVKKHFGILNIPALMPDRLFFTLRAQVAFNKISFQSDITTLNKLTCFRDRKLVIFQLENLPLSIY